MTPSKFPLDVQTLFGQLGVSQRPRIWRDALIYKMGAGKFPTSKSSLRFAQVAIISCKSLCLLFAIGLLQSCDHPSEVLQKDISFVEGNPLSHPCGSGYAEHLGTENLIAHAGGAYEGKTYTNSLEAMTNSYAKGFRMIEIDLMRTADRNFVGLHDWPTWKKQNNFPRPGQIPTTEEFFQHPSSGGFTPVDYAGIQQWLKERPDAILVTDKIRDFKFLAENTLDHDRLIVETFGFDQYVSALQHGIKRPMLSIHFDAKVANDEEILAFVDKWNVKYATIYLPALDTRSALVDNLVRRKVCIYAYTSDSEDQITTYHARGVHGFYTDFYTPAYWRF